LQKKTGNFGKANSRVGNVDVSNILLSRVKVRFVYKERGERRICLQMLVLLYNMRARMVSINQIRNTYMKHLMRNANEDVLF
jgi:hypothetical protein